MQKSKINVIKVPNNKIEEVKKANFPRMPRMYLELIENKEKIKPNLVNKEYDPDEIETVISTAINNNEDIENYENESEIDSNSDKKSFYEDNEDNDKNSEEDIESDENIDKNDSENNSEEDSENYIENDINDEEDSENNESKDNESMYDENRDNKSLDNESRNNYKNRGEDDEEIISDNLSVSSKKTSSSKSSIQLTREENIKKNATREKLREILKDAPKLSELEQRGEVKNRKVIPNIGNTVIEEEDDLKRELLYKFELLKRVYKNVDIPDFNMHSDYKNMNKTYENILRRVSLDSNVESYKNYLIAGFMLIEYILGFWLKFDMAGFTQQQMLNLNQYERLLIELGEKSYVPDDKKWPVELRLIGLIIMNAVIFIIAKMILNKTGTSLFGFMNASNSQSSFENKNKTKRKMKGPNIDINSIPDIENQNSQE